MHPLQYVAVILAAVAAGLINAVAGGGSLITFPALLYAGLPPVAANVTNNIALVPGIVGASYAYRRELGVQTARLRALALTTGAGGLVGSVILLASPGAVFRRVVPFLILAACALLAAQPTITRLARIERDQTRGRGSLAVHVPMFLIAVYGGYFGAGISLMMMAVLTLFFDDGMQHLNALKGALSLVINGVAAVVFALFGPVAWLLVLLMGLGGIAGGQIGVAVARRFPGDSLRWVVVVYGTAAALRLLVA